MKEYIKELNYLFEHFYAFNFSFRKLSRSDTFPLYTATQHESFNSFLGWSKPNSIEEMSLIIDEFIEDIDKNNISMFSIVTHEGEWVGNVKVMMFLDSVAISIWYSPKFWKKPIILKSFQASLFLTFEIFPKIYARIVQNYATMDKMVSHLNFELISQAYVQHRDNHTINCNLYLLNKHPFVSNFILNLTNY